PISIGPKGASNVQMAECIADENQNPQVEIVPNGIQNQVDETETKV
uniref:Uncharacterized protein n=1 Tax=Acrobeloides nanus TaxID=290746 RepID=A0A914EF06_9BILA